MNYLRSARGGTLHREGCYRSKTAEPWHLDESLKKCSLCFRPTPSERFWPKVKMAGPDECWEWQANRQSEGYGYFNVTWRKPVGAHRFAYEEMVGPIPEGLYLDHLCRNRACVNPWHLEPVTPLVNSRRGAATMPNACRNGHPRTAENTYIHPKTGWRQCRVCLADRKAAA